MGFIDRIKSTFSKSKPQPSKQVSRRSKDSASISEVKSSDKNINPKRGGMSQLRRSTIPDSELEYEARRNPLAGNYLRKMKNDPFRGGYEIESPVDDLKIMAEQLIEKSQFNTYLARSFIYSKVFGISLIYMNLPVEESLADPVKKGMKVIRKKYDDEIDYEFPFLSYISSLSKSQIAKDPDMDEYNNFLKWYIYSNEDHSGYGKSVEINGDRIIPITNWWLDGSYKGSSELSNIYNGLSDLDDADVANIEAFMKSATGIVTLELPASHAPGQELDADPVTDEDWQWAEDEFVDVDHMKQFIHPKDWKVNVVNMNKGVNPNPYFDNIYKSVSAGSGVAKILLTGAEAGQLTGSEYIIRKYHELVMDWQNELTEPVKEFIKRYQKWGVLPEGTFSVKWKPVDAPSESERATINQRKSMSIDKFADFLKKMEDLGWTHIIWNNTSYMVKADRNGNAKGLKIPNILEPIELTEIDIDRSQLEDISKMHPSTVEEPEEEKPEDEEPIEGPIQLEPEMDSVHMDGININQELRDKILNQWGTDDLLNSEIAENSFIYRDGVKKSIDKYMAKFDALLQKTGIADYDPDAVQVLVSGMSEGLNSKPIADSVKTVLTSSLEAGYLNYLEIAGYADIAGGIGYKPFDIGMDWAAEYLATNVDSLASEIKSKITQDMVEAMRQGLKNGIHYRDIAKNMKAAGLSYVNKYTERNVHKMCHSALAKSRIEAAVANNDASEIRPMVYITVGDDRVRPEHRDREGNLYTPKVMETLLDEWNCRCTCVPTTAVERARGRSLSKTELGEYAPVWEE